MNQRILAQSQSATPTRNSRTATPPLQAVETKYSPPHAVVARRAFLNYEKQGAQPGHELQHWLTAEAELIAEYEFDQVYGLYD